MRNRTEIYENSIKKSFKNPSKINENEVHGGVLGWLWGYLGSCWLKVIGLGTFWPQFGGSWGHLGSKRVDPGPFWAPTWGSKWAKIGPKSDPKRYPLDDRFEDWFLKILERIWLHLELQKPPKMEPSWVQNRSKFGVDLRAIFERISVSFFLQFCTPHNIAEGTNIL